MMLEKFSKASQSKRESVKKSARAWLKYTDAEQERVRNLNLRKESISNSYYLYCYFAGICG